MIIIIKINRNTLKHLSEDCYGMEKENQSKKYSKGSIKWQEKRKMVSWLRKLENKEKREGETDEDEQDKDWDMPEEWKNE